MCSPAVEADGRARWWPRARQDRGGERRGHGQLLAAGAGRRWVCCLVLSLGFSPTALPVNSERFVGRGWRRIVCFDKGVGSNWAKAFPARVSKRIGKDTACISPYVKALGPSCALKDPSVLCSKTSSEWNKGFLGPDGAGGGRQRPVLC